MFYQSSYLNKLPLMIWNAVFQKLLHLFFHIFLYIEHKIDYDVHSNCIDIFAIEYSANDITVWLPSTESPARGGGAEERSPRNQLLAERLQPTLSPRRLERNHRAVGDVARVPNRTKWPARPNPPTTGYTTLHPQSCFFTRGE